MKVTTLRFGADLWGLLESEAGRAGVSVSQYIREAALARAAATAGSRGEDPFELLAKRESDSPVGKNPGEERAPRQRSEVTRRAAAERVSGARALTAESEQALRHARAVMARSQERVRRAGGAAKKSP